MTRCAPYRFRLYVAGDAQNSAQALANLKVICREHLRDRHTIEVVDVFRTLVRLSPHPVRRIVGTLSQSQPVLHALGLGSPSV